MKAGFTGTRNGMSSQQHQRFNSWVLDNRIHEFHHGDCIGADAQAASRVANCCPRAEIHLRPCTMTEMRAYGPSHVEYPEKTPFARNRDIVDACDVLLACPYTAEEQEWGGTWYTIRYARKKGKRVVIFNPDGSVVDSAAPEPTQ